MKTIPNIRTAKDQPKDRLFRMGMRFSLDLEPVEVNHIAQACGFREKAVIRNASSVLIEQTVPFVPDPDAIRGYEGNIRQSVRTDAFLCAEARFTGYDYLYEIVPGQPAVPDAPKEEDNEDDRP